MHFGVKKDNTGGVASFASYSGPKAKVAVADFDVKAAKAGSEIGAGLRAMLVSTLMNSNRFAVVEPQALSDASSALIISVTVTEFEPQASGGAAGVGAGGGIGNGILGGLLGTPLNRANMALDVKIIDASTSGILADTLVQGQAADPGTALGAGWNRSGLGNGLSAYSNTPMEKAIRVCIVEAVNYIIQSVPENYYKS
jgi:curli biogenesis system outer membrane secretion channel CsgG